MNANTFKTVLEYQNKKVYIDFDRGYDHVFKSIKRAGYDSPFDAQCFQMKVKFTHQGNENLKYLAKIIDKKDYLMQIFRAYQYITLEKGFDKHLTTLIKEDKIHSLIDVLCEGNMQQFRNVQESYKKIAPKEKEPEEMKFEEITIFNKPALFTPARINRAELPKGLYCYECQHDDDQNGIITMIGNSIHVNFWGTILTTKKIGLHLGYRDVDEDKNIVFHDTKNITLSDYLCKHPIAKNKHVR